MYYLSNKNLIRFDKVTHYYYTSMDKTSWTIQKSKPSELTLLLMGCFQTLFLMGGGAQSAPPPIFICENHRKSNKIMHCVEKKII